MKKKLRKPKGTKASKKVVLYEGGGMGCGSVNPNTFCGCVPLTRGCGY